MKLAGGMLILLAAGVATAQIPAVSHQAVISFSVANPQVEPAHYSIEIREDGTGVYKATYTSYRGDTAAAPVDRIVHVHDPVLKQIFSVARKYHFFTMDCQGSHRRVAFTGRKTLAYSGPDGNGSCAFNYSSEKEINEVATNLIAVTTTLAMGADLAREHQYDRLSLDAELAALQDAVAGKRALEIENIAPVLESIANDDAVMNRARARAQKLLNEAITTR